MHEKEILQNLARSATDTNVSSNSDSQPPADTTTARYDRFRQQSRFSCNCESKDGMSQFQKRDEHHGINGDLQEILHHHCSNCQHTEELGNIGKETWQDNRKCNQRRPITRKPSHQCMVADDDNQYLKRDTDLEGVASDEEYQQRVQRATNVQCEKPPGVGYSRETSGFQCEDAGPHYDTEKMQQPIPSYVFQPIEGAHVINMNVSRGDKPCSCGETGAGSLRGHGSNEMNQRHGENPGYRNSGDYQQCKTCSSPQQMCPNGQDGTTHGGKSQEHRRNYLHIMSGNDRELRQSSYNFDRRAEPRSKVSNEYQYMRSSENQTCKRTNEREQYTSSHGDQQYERPEYQLYKEPEDQMNKRPENPVYRRSEDPKYNRTEDQEYKKPGEDHVYRKQNNDLLNERINEGQQYNRVDFQQYTAANDEPQDKSTRSSQHYNTAADDRSQLLEDDQENESSTESQYETIRDILLHNTADEQVKKRARFAHDERNIETDNVDHQSKSRSDQKYTATIDVQEQGWNSLERQQERTNYNQPFVTSDSPQLSRVSRVEQSTRARGNPQSERVSPFEQSKGTSGNSQSERISRVEPSMGTSINPQSERVSRVEQSMGTSINPQSERVSRVEQSMRTSRNPQSERVSHVEQSMRTSRNLQSERVSRAEQSMRTSRNPQSERVSPFEQSMGTSRNPQSERVSPFEQSMGTSINPQSERISRAEQSMRTSRNPQSERVSPFEQSMGTSRNPQSERISPFEQSMGTSRNPQSERISPFEQSVGTSINPQSERISRAEQSMRTSRNPQSERVSRVEQSMGTSRNPQSERVSHAEQSMRTSRNPQSERVSRVEQSMGTSRNPQSERVSRFEQSTRASINPQSERISRAEQSMRTSRNPQSERVSRVEQSMGTSRTQSERVSPFEQSMGTSRNPQSERISPFEQSMGASINPQSERISRAEQSMRTSRNPQSERVSRVEQSMGTSRNPQSERVSRFEQSTRASINPQSERISRAEQSMRTSRNPQSERVSRVEQSMGTSRTQSERVSPFEQSMGTSRNPRSERISPFEQSMGTSINPQSERISRAEQSMRTSRNPQSERVSRVEQSMGTSRTQSERVSLFEQSMRNDDNVFVKSADIPRSTRVTQDKQLINTIDNTVNPGQRYIRTQNNPQSKRATNDWQYKRTSENPQLEEVNYDQPYVRTNDKLFDKSNDTQQFERTSLHQQNVKTCDCPCTRSSENQEFRRVRDVKRYAETIAEQQHESQEKCQGYKGNLRCRTCGNQQYASGSRKLQYPIDDGNKGICNTCKLKKKLQGQRCQMQMDSAVWSKMEEAGQKDKLNFDAAMKQMEEHMNSISQVCECYYDSCSKDNLSLMERRHLRMFHKGVLPCRQQPKKTLDTTSSSETTYPQSRCPCLDSVSRQQREEKSMGEDRLQREEDHSCSDGRQQDQGRLSMMGRIADTGRMACTDRSQNFTGFSDARSGLDPDLDDGPQRAYNSQSAGGAQTAGKPQFCVRFSETGSKQANINSHHSEMSETCTSSLTSSSQLKDLQGSTPSHEDIKQILSMDSTTDNTLNSQSDEAVLANCTSSFDSCLPGPSFLKHQTCVHKSGHKGAANARHSYPSQQRQKPISGIHLPQGVFVEGVSAFPTKTSKILPKSSKGQVRFGRVNSEQGIFITTKPGSYIVKKPTEDSSIHLLQVNPGNYVKLNL